MEWKSIKDQQPKEHLKNYLVLYQDVVCKDVCIAQWDAGSNEFFERYNTTGYPILPVTHWADLPDFPKD